jgi:hypothetical protein
MAHPANKRMGVQLSKALDLKFGRVLTLMSFVLLFHLKALFQWVSSFSYMEYLTFNI